MSEGVSAYKRRDYVSASALFKEAAEKSEPGSMSELAALENLQLSNSNLGLKHDRSKVEKRIIFLRSLHYDDAKPDISFTKDSERKSKYSYSSSQVDFEKFVKECNSAYKNKDRVAMQDSVEKLFYLCHRTNNNMKAASYLQTALKLFNSEDQRLKRMILTWRTFIQRRRGALERQEQLSSNFSNYSKDQANSQPAPSSGQSIFSGKKVFKICIIHLAPTQEEVSQTVIRYKKVPYGHYEVYLDRWGSTRRRWVQDGVRSVPYRGDKQPFENVAEHLSERFGVSENSILSFFKRYHSLFIVEHGLNTKVLVSTMNSVNTSDWSTMTDVVFSEVSHPYYKLVKKDTTSSTIPYLEVKVLAVE